MMILDVIGRLTPLRKVFKGSVPMTAKYVSDQFVHIGEIELEK